MTPRRASTSLSAPVFAALLLGCAGGMPKLVPYAAPARPAPQSWAHVFASPSPVEVRVLVTGTSHQALEKQLDASGLRAAGMDPSEAVDSPIIATLIHHDRLGDYLVDAGLDASFSSNAHGNLHGMLVGMFSPPMAQAPGHDLMSRLRALDAHPRGVFLTHLHPDHTAGIPSLPDGLDYFVGALEPYPNYPLLFHGDHLKKVRQMSVLDFTGASSLPPLGPTIDVLGDGSVWAVATPGHTPGHVSYVVNARRGPVLIAGDVSPMPVSLQRGILPARLDNRDNERLSLTQIRVFVDQFPNVRVIYGHADGPASVEHPAQPSLRH